MRNYGRYKQTYVSKKVMKTPICDFIKKYCESDSSRFHMPGHKGVNVTGSEQFDITEIDGAGCLYDTEGLIVESERNASTLFGANTFYSTEGSSLSIRAMLFLALKYAKKQGVKPIVAVGRNAHKAFLSAAALLDIEPVWIFPDKNSYLSCQINANSLRSFFKSQKNKVFALYLTSPDYLGNTVDVKEISAVCKEYGVLLLVDNAHGAYLKFLPTSLHPIDLGADMCCDSAHKTLCSLTGGAYLHVSKTAPEDFSINAKSAMALFGSTSPSYLILQSLDKLNESLENDYTERLNKLTIKIQNVKNLLLSHGYDLCGNEPLKITIKTKSYGYEGGEFSDLLKENKIICEFYDNDFVVLMLSVENSYGDIDKLQNILLSIPKRAAILDIVPPLKTPQKAMTIREATLSPSEIISVENALGRVLSVPSVSCPPAVPIIVSGEIIDDAAIKCFNYFGIKKCEVVK